LLTLKRHKVALAIATILSLLCSNILAYDYPATKVYLNGVQTPVYFSDGDSFRVLDGPLSGMRTRIAGFNTLESYGAVHRWGNWHEKELSHIAYKGTMNARKGVWHCESNMRKDTYGRTLWDCVDLSLSQVEKGLAHVMLIGKPLPYESKL